MTILPDSIKKMFKPAGGAQAAEAAVAGGALRRSNGLREFCRELKGQQGLRVLDLGAASQANITFFTELGHKVYTEDIYPVLSGNSYRVRDENGQWRFDPEAFLAENVSYQMLLFDAVLCWDLFDRLEENAVRAVAARLHRVVKPGGVLLAFFHTAEPGASVPIHRYRIQGEETLELLSRGQLALRRPLNNRNIELLFRDFHSLKFFLARDNLREVLVVR
jgi:SAM-dependent methyltransferase